MVLRKLGVNWRWGCGLISNTGFWEGGCLFGAFESGVRAGLSSCLACGADMVACVVFPSTELTSNLLSANCGVVTKALAGIALTIGLYISVCSTPCLYYSNK